MANRPFISVKSTTSTFDALCDSGAAASCISYKQFIKLSAQNIVQRLPLPLGLKLKGAGGAPLTIKGFFKLNFIILNRRISHNFFVIDNLISDAILGTDFIASQRIAIWGTGYETRCAFTDRMTLANQAPIQAVKTDTKPIILPFAFPKETMTIPAKSAATIPIHFHGQQPPISQYVLTADDHGHVEVIDGIVDLNNESPFIIMVNNNDHNIEIERTSPIGNIHPLIDFHIQEVTTAVPQQLYKPHLDTSTPASDRDRWKRIQQQIKLSHLPQDEAAKYNSLFYEFRDIFSLHKYDIGTAKMGEHRIRLDTNAPLFTKQFKIPEAHEHDLNDHIHQLKKAGCLELSTSPYNSPIFLVKKKDNSSRIVLDYRLLNKHTLPDKYSIRDVRACIDEIGKSKAQIFSCLDITSGYHQVPLAEAARPYTSFHITGQPKLQWTRSPMGLTGSGSTFAKLMDIVMDGLAAIITYIDDILCHSTDHESQRIHLRKAFKRMREFNLKLNPRKCEFGKTSVDYLGFHIDKNGVKPGQTKIDAINDFPEPTSPKKIRQFLGIANYFRSFIRQFTTTAAPLTQLTSSTDKWEGGELPPDAKFAFNTLKHKLSSRPCMAYPDFSRPFELFCDAATGDDAHKGGLGAFLIQRDDQNNPKAISYLSRTLKPHEENLSAYALEMRSAIWAIKSLHHYLKGRHFTVISDNKPLVANTNNTSKAINRLQQTLMDYDATIIHQPGSANAVADILSRNAAAAPPTDKDAHNNYDIDDVILQSPITSNEHNFVTAQIQDPILAFIRAKVTTNDNPPPLPEKFSMAIINNDIKYAFLDKDNILRRKLLKSKESPAFLPHAMISETIKAAHSSILAGHGGIAKTMAKITPHYYWKGMTKDIKIFVTTCETCQLAKGRQPPHAPLQSMPIPDGPNERVHIDLMGPLQCNGQYRYILVLTDAFTKYATTAPLPNKKAATVAKAIFDNWIATFACPKIWVSDQGKEFCNQLFKEFNNTFGIKLNNTSAYHPQTNSSAESYNRTIIKFMKTSINDNKDWHKHLKHMTLAYNTNLHQTIKTTPFALTFTFPPSLPYFDLAQPNQYYTDGNLDFKRLRDAFQEAHDHTKEAIQKQERAHNKSAKDRLFNIGDKVMLLENKMHPKYTGQNRKFLYNYQGPFIITHKYGPLNYGIAKHPHNPPIKVHIDRLKRFLYSDLFNKQQQQPQQIQRAPGPTTATPQKPNNTQITNLKPKSVKFVTPAEIDTFTRDKLRKQTMPKTPHPNKTPKPKDHPATPTSGATPNNRLHAATEIPLNNTNVPPHPRHSPEQLRLIREEAKTTAKRIREMAVQEGRRAASESAPPTAKQKRRASTDPLADVPRLNTFQTAAEQQQSSQRLSAGTSTKPKSKNPITAFLNNAASTLQVGPSNENTARQSARIRNIPAPEHPLVPRRPPEYKQYKPANQHTKK